MEATRLRTAWAASLMALPLSGGLAAWPMQAIAQPAAAERWPTRTIRVIAPFTPGSAGDVVARVLQPNLSDLLKQSVVVDNRPGAGGNVASAIAARSSPDVAND